MQIFSGVMSCVCQMNYFNYFNEISQQNVSYCCPLGSTIINNACGCDSTGTTKLYNGANAMVPSILNSLAMNGNSLN